MTVKVEQVAPKAIEGVKNRIAAGVKVGLPEAEGLFVFRQLQKLAQRFLLRGIKSSVRTWAITI